MQKKYSKFFILNLFLYCIFLQNFSFGMHALKHKKSKSIKNGLYDSLIYSDVIFPFIRRYKEILKFRSVNSCGKKAVEIFSQKRPPYLKKIICKKNFAAFKEWLQNIDFYIYIHKEQPFLFGENNKKIEEIFEQLRNTLRCFTIYSSYNNLYLLKSFSLIDIRALDVITLSDKNLSLITSTPQNLEILKINTGYIKDEHLLSLPKKLKALYLFGGSLKGTFFEYLYDSIEKLVLGYDITQIMKHIKHVKNLKFLNVKHASCSPDLKKIEMPQNIKEIVFGNFNNCDITVWLEALPDSLEVLDISSLQERIDGKILKYISRMKNLKKCKLNNLKYIKKTEVKILPKMLSQVYVFWKHYTGLYVCDCISHYLQHDCSIDYMGKHNQIKIIKELRKKGVQVKTFQGNEFPKNCTCDCDKCTQSMIVKIYKDKDGKYKNNFICGQNKAYAGRTFDITF